MPTKLRLIPQQKPPPMLLQHKPLLMLLKRKQTQIKQKPLLMSNRHLLPKL